MLRRVIRRAAAGARDRSDRPLAQRRRRRRPDVPVVPGAGGEPGTHQGGSAGRGLVDTERGLGLFEEIAAGDFIAGEDAFKLHDTYGFPLELTRELAAERGLAVDEEEFTRLMAEQRARSKTKALPRSRSRWTAPARRVRGLRDHRGADRDPRLRDLGDGTFQAKLERCVLSRGRRPGLRLRLHRERGHRRACRPDPRDAGRRRPGADVRGEGLRPGRPRAGRGPWSVRFPTMANHTATHLLHQALRDLLGDQVRQAGSAVRPDKLRFDFTYDKALTPEEREQIEQAVNEKVFQNYPVRTYVTPIEEARKLGAMMLFGEKYGDEVRVVEIDDYSRELCGGAHVRSTAEIGPFVILRGVGWLRARRIEAVTAGEAWALPLEAEEAEELRAEVQQLRKGAAQAGCLRAGSDLPGRIERHRGRGGRGAQGLDPKDLSTGSAVQAGFGRAARIRRRGPRLPRRQPRSLARRPGAGRCRSRAEGGGEDRRRGAPSRPGGGRRESRGPPEPTRWRRARSRQR